MININELLIKLVIVNITLVLLLYSYKFYVVDGFSYMGFSWTPSLERSVVGFLCVNVLASCLTTKAEKVSDFLLAFHFLFPILPMIMIFIASGYDFEFLFAICICFLILIFIVNIKPYMFNGIAINEFEFLNALTFIVCIVIGIIFALGGYKYFNLDIKKVYEFRQGASDNLPAFFGYITPVVSKVLIPIMIVLSLKLKLKIHFLLGVLCSVLMFALTAHKSPLMYPIVVTFLYLLLTKWRNLNVIYLGYISVIFILLLFAPISEIAETLSSMILRRTFVFPAFINTLYYDYFSNNEFIYFSLSKVSLGLIDYPYYSRPGFLISAEYFGRPMQNSNTGWIGSGYMQFGFIGMAIYTLLLGGIIYLLNCLSIEKDWKLISASMVGLFLSVFQSVDLLTTIFTHGLGVAILIVAFFPKQP